MELTTRLNWLGIAVASAGVAVLVFGAPEEMVHSAPARLPGNLLMLGAAWIYGGYIVICKRWMSRLGELHVICRSFAAGGILLALAGARQLAATEWAEVTPAHWVGMAYVTVLAGFVGLVLWYRAIGRTSASGTAAYEYLVPCVSLVAAAILLSERLAALQLFGIAVTLAGVYVARVPPHPPLSKAD